MCQVIVFAGTTEGYEICRFLERHQVAVLASVATEYGSRSLSESENLTVHSARLTEEEMEKLIQQEQPSLVLDATHPYAREVTENLKKACEKTGIFYQRVLREEGEKTEEAVYVESAKEAARYLEKTKGAVLLTTGSKELSSFTSVPDYQNRLYARVLSLPSVISECAKLGFEGKHLIGMQGPFSTEMNVAMLRQFSCRYLVTKDTGKAGGFEEKLEAARRCQVTPIIIGRPEKETGLSVFACKRMLMKRFSLSAIQKVTLLGIGPGSGELLTLEGEKVLEEAELLIGAERMIQSVRRPHHAVYQAYQSEEIVAYLKEHPEYEKVVIALSGDVGFFSGAKKLLTALNGRAEVVCGISSLAYFMAKIGLSWDDAELVSAHGRDANLVFSIRHREKTFAILGTSDGVASLARKLAAYHLGEVLLYVGENLSYEKEKIFWKPAKELQDYQGDTLSVVCAQNLNYVSYPATHGICDREFLRGKAPMTKEEVRSVSLSKLQLFEDSICYDIGAGTGSVTVEMALRAFRGKVFAIEKKEEAYALLLENKIRFFADNLELIRGTAPEALAPLPAPTHAFIGGSSGKLREIIRLLLEKNPYVRIVINCITLETLGEAMGAVKEFQFAEPEIVQLSAARAKKAGPYHMMTGENPIYILTLQNREVEK